MPKKEKKEISLFWQGLVMGLLTGIMGDLFVSYLMKVYEFVELPLFVWLGASVVTFSFVIFLIWFMWKKGVES